MAALKGIRTFRCAGDSNRSFHTIRNTRILVIMAGALITLLSMQALSTKTGTCYYINLSHSVPLGLYQVIPPDNLKTGDLVVFEPPQGARSLIYHRHWLPSGWPLMKHIGGLAGDSYSVQQNSFYVNNKYIGPVFARDSEGNTLPCMEGRRTVEQKAFLPISTHIGNSFDGRYFGSVPLASIRGKAIALWTF